ncbi:MAG: GHKL domain-containing protein, partial [Defluviitaleaceae bacterium]|nr:GHKL domain-containing protein [Defluviitaleaceae bacterium]
PFIELNQLALPTIFSSAISAAVLFFFFKLKRFRKGFPFLQREFSGFIGMIISGTIFFAWIIMQYAPPKEGLLIFSGITISIYAIIFWCRHAIFELYKQRLRERERQELEARTKELAADSKRMEEKIRAENNLLRAMQKTYKPFLKNCAEARFMHAKIEILLAERERVFYMEKIHEKNKIMAAIIHRDAKLIPSFREAADSFAEINSDATDSFAEINREPADSFAEINRETADSFAEINREAADSFAEINSAAKLFPFSREPADSFAEINSDAKLFPFSHEAGNSFAQIHRDAHDFSEKICFLFWDAENISDFPATGNPLVDGILKHMMLKAAEKGIKLDTKIKCTLAEFDKIAVSHLDFETIIVDLLENAIFATASCKQKQILISFGEDEDFFAITVLDSGVPFAPETLKNLGKNPASTHLDDGGSGIGYMSMFNIMQKYSASLIIREFAPNPEEFTKSVVFRLDGKNAYNVYTDCVFM